MIKKFKEHGVNFFFNLLKPLQVMMTGHIVSKKITSKWNFSSKQMNTELVKEQLVVNGETPRVVAFFGSVQT